MVSVVDAATFLDRFEVLEELHEMGVGRDDEDDRSVTDLLVDQIEFANVLVISKPDLVDAHKLERVVATVRQLNPEAQLVVAEKGDLPLDAVLDTGLADEELGEVNPAGCRRSTMSRPRDRGVRHHVVRLPPSLAVPSKAPCEST